MVSLRKRLWTAANQIRSRREECFGQTKKVLGRGGRKEKNEKSENKESANQRKRVQKKKIR